LLRPIARQQQDWGAQQAAAYVKLDEIVKEREDAAG
jgi:hypothetical protein